MIEETLENPSFFEKGKNTLKQHLVDAPALMLVGNPIYGTFERLVLGISPQGSLDTRIAATVTTFAGVSLLYNAFRDKVHYVLDRRLEFKDLLDSRNVALRDTILSTGFGCSYTAFLYSLSDNVSSSEMITGILLFTALGGAIGAASGYAVDSSRQIFGVGEPNKVRFENFQTSLSAKKNFFLALAASTALTYGISTTDLGDYKGLNPEKYIGPVIEKVLD